MDDFFLDRLLITTTSRTTTTAPITVQIHIHPPIHPPIQPSVWFIRKRLALRCDQRTTGQSRPRAQAVSFEIAATGPQQPFVAGHRGAQQSFLFFLNIPRFVVHTFHPLHHRALRHGFLAHLHVLHHVLHHLLLHLCLSRIHGDPLLHHVGEDGSHHSHFLVLRCVVHLGELLGEFGVLRLHVCHHFLFLFLHCLAAFRHFALHHHLPVRHHLPLRRLGGSCLDWRPDGQGHGQCEAGTDDEVRMRLFFHVLLLSFSFLFAANVTAKVFSLRSV